MRKSPLYLYEEKRKGKEKGHNVVIPEQREHERKRRKKKGCAVGVYPAFRSKPEGKEERKKKGCKGKKKRARFLFLCVILFCAFGKGKKKNERKKPAPPGRHPKPAGGKKGMGKKGR